MGLGEHTAPAFPKEGWELPSFAFEHLATEVGVTLSVDGQRRKMWIWKGACT